MNRAARVVSFLVLIAALAAVTVSVWACSGCALTTPPSAKLLPGDSGACVTARTVQLPDGGFGVTFTPCNFGVSP